MPSLLRVLASVSAALCLSAATATAQNGSILASARVLPRPLSLMDVARSAVPGELQLRIEGCGSGAVTVDSRLSGGTVRRDLRLALPATSACGPRTVAVRLVPPSAAVTDFVVSLEQSDAMLSPSFAQFVVPATRVASNLRSTLGY